jgi:hypothetical protein
MITRGIFLFLFIPLVLTLYLVQPLGTLPSLGLGVAIMLGHRFIAGSFSLRHRLHRCLWCGRPLRLAFVSLDLSGGKGGDASYIFCPPSDRSCRGGWFGLHTLANKYRYLLRLGIVLPVLYYLVAETLRGMGAPSASHALSAGIFKGVVAATVVAISFLYTRYRPIEDPVTGVEGPFPFPVHILTLLGAGWTLWVFRIVGIWWLLELAGKAVDMVL